MKKYFTIVIILSLITPVFSQNYTSDKIRNLTVVYLIPSDLDTISNYQKRLGGVMLYAQKWFNDQMDANGYGKKTFGILKDETLQQVPIYVIRSIHNMAYLNGPSQIKKAVDDYFAANVGISTSQHVLVLLPPYSYTNGNLNKPLAGPYYGYGNYCFASDNQFMDISKIGTSDFTYWVGGMIHELGHAFQLPHNNMPYPGCGNINKAPWDNQADLGDKYLPSMMGVGNSTLAYKNYNTILTPADAAMLNVNEIFNDDTQTYYTEKNSGLDEIHASYNSDSKVITLSGKYYNLNKAMGDVVSPITDIVVYADPNVNSEGTGTNKDYNAISFKISSFTSDTFTLDIPISNLQYRGTFPYEFKIKLIHKNGRINESIYNFNLTDGIPSAEYNMPSNISKIDQSTLTISASSFQSGYDVSKLKDHNMTTYWHSAYSGFDYPHSIVLQINDYKYISGFSYVQRNDLSRALKNVEVAVSLDGVTYTNEGSYVFKKAGGIEYISFIKPKVIKYVKFTAKDAWDSSVFGAIAELNLHEKTQLTRPEDITLTTSSTSICGDVPFTITATSVNSNYIYTWVPINGLSSTNGNSVSATPTNNTTYTVIGVDDELGMATTKTISLTVSPSPTNLEITTSNTTIPINTIQILTTTGGEIPITFSVGTGTFESAGNLLPNVFSVKIGGVKHQMIYEASELKMQGVSSGNITSVAFNIAAFSSTSSCVGFTIRMKNITMATFATYGLLPGATKVFESTIFKPSSKGWVTFNFTTPFVWDGKSNVLVEVVHNSGGSSVTNYNTIVATTMATTKTQYAGANNISNGITGFDAYNAFTTGNYGLSTVRPNIQFGTNVKKITWTPTTNLFTDLDCTIPYVKNAFATEVYSKPSATTTYTAKTDLYGCSKEDSVTLTVPVSKTTITNQPIANTTLCEGNSLDLSIEATGSNLNYTWKRGTTIVGYGTGFVINAASVSDAGNYTCEVSGDNGTVTSQTATVKVNDVTIITTQPYGTTVCIGSPINLYVTASGSNLTYNWKNGDTTVGSGTSFSINDATAFDAGNYICEINSTCGTVISQKAEVVVNQIPTTPIIALKGNVLTSNSLNGNQWYNQNGIILGETNETYIATQFGKYFVVTTINGCSSLTSNTIHYQLLENEFIVERVKIFPNPVINTLSMTDVSNLGNVSFEVISMTGKVLYKKTFTNEIKLDVSILPKGTYFIRFIKDKILGARIIMKN